MKPIVERAQRIIDLLSGRMDDQAMRTGADAPHCVSVYGAFQTAAGDLERILERRIIVVPNVVALVRALAKIQRSHLLMVRMRATYLRAQARKAGPG